MKANPYNGSPVFPKQRMGLEDDPWIQDSQTYQAAKFGSAWDFLGLTLVA